MHQLDSDWLTVEFSISFGHLLNFGSDWSTVDLVVPVQYAVTPAVPTSVINVQ